MAHAGTAHGQRASGSHSFPFGEEAQGLVQPSSHLPQPRQPEPLPLPCYQKLLCSRQALECSGRGPRNVLPPSGPQGRPRNSCSLRQHFCGLSFYRLLQNLLCSQRGCFVCQGSIYCFGNRSVTVAHAPPNASPISRAGGVPHYKCCSERQGERRLHKGDGMN